MTEDSLGGKSFAELGLRILRDYEHPILPETRDMSINIPGRHGALDLGAYMGPRYFSLPCMVIDAKNGTVLQKTVRALASHLLDTYGRPRTLELRLSEEPEKWYNVRLSGALPIERIVRGLGQFTLPLTAFDPFAYAPATYYDPTFIADYNKDTDYDDGVTEYKNQTHTPFTNPRQYAGVFNYSHFATPFSFVIEGYVRNPKITNLTSGVSAQLYVTVEADERLYFDSKLMTTWKVKASDDRWFWLTPNQIMRHPTEWDKINKYNDMSGHFIDLVSGDNSLLFEGERPDAQIHFNWEHRFL